MTQRAAPIRFEPLTAGDLPLVLRWLRRAHVRAWWGDPPTAAELCDELLPRLAADSPVRCFIAWSGDVRIGFVQCYRVADAGEGWWEDETDPGARGIDQFLADGRRLGRGLGSAMVRAFVDSLFADAQVSVVQTDPRPDNRRAIGCYRRAGFTEAGVVDTPDGPALLMRITRRRWAAARGAAGAAALAATPE